MSDFQQLSQDKKGFAKQIFSLDNLITPQILVWIYRLVLVVILITTILSLFSGVMAILSGTILSGLMIIVASLIALCISMVFARLSFELMIVAFSNNVYLRRIANK